MERECLAFFKERFDARFYLTNVRKAKNHVEFTIKSFKTDCITLILYKDLSTMQIEYVSKCNLTGEETIKTAIEFALDKGISTIELIDASEIDYTLSTGETKSISLYQLSLLKSGYTWYESFGFKNEFDQHRDFWMYCIHQPFETTYAYLQHLPRDIAPLIDEHKAYLRRFGPELTVSEHFIKIHDTLKEKCPKPLNRCDLDYHAFQQIQGFILKSFQLLMLALFTSYREVRSFDHLNQLIQSYHTYQLTFLENGTMVNVQGAIGTIVGKRVGVYDVQFETVEAIPMQYVKPLDKVVLHGLKEESMNHSVGTIVGKKKDRYVIDLGAKKYSVKHKNVKGIGGKRKSKRI